MLIDIAHIEVGTRLRGTTAEQVTSLAESIAEVGLISPIAVYRRPVIRANISVDGFGLIAGLHRLEACRSLGLVQIEANVVEADDLRRQLAECDENLCGAKLSPAEKSLFTERRKQIYIALHPETRHGGNQAGPSGQFGHTAKPDFTADTASKTGQSERAVRRDATRGERIAEDALELIRGTSADKGVVLDRLAAAPKDEQVEMARQIIASRSKPVPLPKNEMETEEDWRGSMMRLWNRAPDEWRERFIEYVQEPVFDTAAAGRN